MLQVLTEKQAREITGGRTPLVPVEYEEACKALAACVTLDEAKYWDNKADALAAWAKIYHDDKAGRNARALKLWAYRRIGELAAELQPGRKPGRGGGSSPGPTSLLMEKGFQRYEANAARRLARAPKAEVERLTSLPRPPAPTYLSESGFKAAPYATGKPFADHPSWRRFWSSCCSFESAIRVLDPIEMARSVTKAQKVRERIARAIEWLDTFEQHLPKE